MADKSQKGTPTNHWQVTRRCLAILNHLLQGPAKKGALLTAVYAVEGKDAYGSQTGKPLNRRFEEDKKRLRVHLGIDVRYDKRVGGYLIAGWERPLLNLPNADIQTLAYLADTFQPDAPKMTEVHQLINRLVSWLPPERQQLLQKIAGQQPTADLRLRDSEEIAPDVWEKLLEAWQAKQELQFDYLSSQHEDGILRQHHIQPWDLDFTDRGHWRLRGFCLFNDGPNGPWSPRDYFNYRVSRIVSGSVEILSKKLPPIRPLGKPRQVIFELAPAIARFGVSQRKELIGETKISTQENGWTRIESKTHDVFDLARNLLYYGDNCRVLGGDQLLREVKTLISNLELIYRDSS
ncbi:hypothetical protein MNBD_CHLOROFLEXI01-256 [hydrothermal vent metagenome]|uniref:Uncharacterized protein n=1 Tax=hydrothermal vent metagenome TaxID=652676 RepID=A0A3B0VPX1_9ZZZZ